jgi:acyl carrier protein
MANSPTSEKVVDIVSATFGVSRDRVGLKTRFTEDLKADSLDLAGTGMEVEDEFDIAIDLDTANSIRTVGDLVTLVEDLLTQKKERSLHT